MKSATDYTVFVSISNAENKATITQVYHDLLEIILRHFIESLVLQKLVNVNILSLLLFIFLFNDLPHLFLRASHSLGNVIHLSFIRSPLILLRFILLLVLLLLVVHILLLLL